MKSLNSFLVVNDKTIIAKNLSISLRLLEDINKLQNNQLNKLFSLVVALSYIVSLVRISENLL